MRGHSVHVKSKSGMLTTACFQVRKTIRPTKYRPSLKPGTVLILLAGRFRGKRVILLKTLSQGVLLVTGPFKINGVPLRRVNARYVIATSTSVDLSGLDAKTVEKVGGDEYFAREKKDKKTGEDAFFKQGEKPEVSSDYSTHSQVAGRMLTPQQKKPVDSKRSDDQKAVDKPLIATIKKEPLLASYLNSSFSLRKGDRPHEMVF
ncbi:MAG: hypothetical protein INR71_15710 [Terriglobus roseus]|nr:hypothetical protein [Terriglobus roseus]